MSFRSRPPAVRIASWAVVACVICVLVSTCAASVDAAPAMPDQTAVVLEIGVLVFREGLECILVLAAITASMVGPSRRYQRPIAAGAGIAFVSTLLTWRFAIRIVDDLTQNMPALDVQAITGLLAVIVLIVVMNWFFHKMYWTGWISLHNRKKAGITSECASGLVKSPCHVGTGAARIHFTLS
jgi:high-affinity iron transporter